MNMQMMMRYVLIFVVSLAMLTGCGSSGSDGGDGNGSAPVVEQNSSTTNEVENNDSTDDGNGSTPVVENNLTKTKGYLIDSPLQGVTYVCDGKEGLTDADGMFECVAPPVTFKIGGLTIGTLTAFTADGKIYPQDLLGLPRTNFTDSTLKLLTRFLQSLDDDGVISTNINIEQSVRDGITTVQDFQDMGESNIKSLISGLGKSFVNECGAMKHLGNTSVTCNSDGGYYVAPVVNPPVNQKNHLKITLKTTEKIAGYEVHLKFTNDTSIQGDVTMDNSFLGTTGRTVNNLGADINSSTKEIKFGGFSFGSQEGVTGEFDVMTLKSKDSQSEITIVKQNCIDKDANDIACDVEIVNN